MGFSLSLAKTLVCSEKKGLGLSSLAGIICTNGKLIVSGNVGSVLCARGMGEMKNSNFGGFYAPKQRL